MEKMSSINTVVLILFAAVGLIIPAAIILRHFFSIDPLALLHLTWGRTVLGTIFTLLSTVTCLWNCYVSLYVPWSYEKEHGSMAGFAHTSGLPFIGGIFLFLSGVLMPPSVSLASYLLFLYAIDGNGMPWFFISIIRNSV